MKKVIYYLVLVVVFMACMFATGSVIALVEGLLKIELGEMLKSFAFIACFGLFVYLKGLIRTKFKF